MRKLIVVFIVLILVTGCWDKTELEDQAIISAIGIDQKGKEKQVFLQIVKPEAISGGRGQGGGGGKQPTFLVTGTGKTIAEAIAKITVSSPRRLFWGQAKVIIFGNEIGKQGIKPALDWVERVYGIRFNTLIFTTKEDLHKLMRGNFDLGHISFFTLSTMNKLQREMNVPYSPPLAKFVNSMLLPGHVSYAGQLGVKGKGLVVQGLGIFKNGVFTNSLNLEQMTDLMRLNNYTRDGAIPLPCSNKAGRYMTIRIEKEKTTYKADMSDGKPRLDFKITIAGLVESTHCEKRLTEKELKNIEKQLNSVMQKRLRSIIDMAQKEVNIDFIGFGDKLKRKNLSAWREVEKNWDAIFPSVESSIKVDSTIRGVELITDPLLPGETEDSK